MEGCIEGVILNVYTPAASTLKEGLDESKELRVPMEGCTKCEWYLEHQPLLYVPMERVYHGGGPEYLYPSGIKPLRRVWTSPENSKCPWRDVLRVNGIWSINPCCICL
jgi:hypothetical protein